MMNMVELKIAVDIGGTSIRAALMKGEKVLRLERAQTPQSKDKFLKVLTLSISKIFDKKAKGIGIGCPGPLKNGTILNPPNLPIKNFNLQKFISNKFNKKTAVDNDAKCVALAELEYDIKKKNFIILTLGTGIGGGIIINRKLYYGRGNAGEFGHMILDKGKDLETLWQKYSKKKISVLIKSKKKKEREDLAKLIGYLGQGIASLIDEFDPEVIVLNGGAKETGDKFLKPLKKAVNKYCILPSKPKIMWSRLKEPGLLGASLLIK